ncbi:ArsR/SmtB family transcription factor [Ectobacillus sp. sgz5001026]|uniref:ArsR/SmtB family transcription factor n=1 Tax=Ectobacillus sp. sgz5001026 TaxID=3242473 RepID=UPI0036D3C302
MKKQCCSVKNSVKSDEEAKAVVQQSAINVPLLKNNEQLLETAEFFKALGDETRIKIIGMLSVEDLCMCEIVSGLQIATSTISHHLKLLERGKVIQSRKEGRYTVYNLNKEKVLAYIN